MEWNRPINLSCVGGASRLYPIPLSILLPLARKGKQFRPHLPLLICELLKERPVNLSCVGGASRLYPIPLSILFPLARKGKQFRPHLPLLICELLKELRQAFRAHYLS
jgi:hypothetical protein